MGRFSDRHRLFKGIVISLKDEVDRPLCEGPQLDITDRFHYSPLRILEGDLSQVEHQHMDCTHIALRDILTKIVLPKEEDKLEHIPERGDCRGTFQGSTSYEEQK
jgi:hypothetical protein